MLKHIPTLESLKENHNSERISQTVEICPICKKGNLRLRGKMAYGLFYYFQCENCGLEFFSRSKPYKKETCEICGYDKHPYALERHHCRDGRIVVLCGNCHNIITQTGRQGFLYNDVKKREIMINAVMKTLNPLNPKLLEELLIEELGKYINYRQR